ncbi:MAG TPA: BadF/BadG/BcrA/BcrD ATPase family protein, partial [Chloroflexota bacterium]|nr:BadF/BadG/BcrA/BcrD ATPase family protein [Chloroflexota bacterium]
MPDSVTPRSPLDYHTALDNDSSRPVYLGLDIGSVNARVAVVSQEGELLHLDSQRLYSGPVSAVRVLVDRLLELFPISRISGAAATGSGRQLYGGQPGWQLFSSPYAAIVGLLHDHPDARTIIEIGGQSALVIGLAGGMEKPWRVARSPLCAAGTGRFLEQQASRLGIAIDQFGPRSLEWTQAPPRIAARCSVFAKSDLIHLQQKGWPVSAMLAGLSDSVARMIVAQWRDSFEPPIYCVGGGASNEGVVRALSSALGGTPVTVPREHASREAIGAALLARASKAAPGSLAPQQAGEGGLYLVPHRLEQHPSPNGWAPTELGPEVVDAWLGVDVGSTSTKAALVDREGRVPV